MTPYEEYNKKVAEYAASLPAPAKKVSQAVLWLKAGASTHIDALKDEEITTFKTGEMFGFTEQYVNLLMQYAYDQGMQRGRERVVKEFEARSKRLEDAVKDIVEALDSRDLLPEENCGCCD